MPFMRVQSQSLNSRQHVDSVLLASPAETEARGTLEPMPTSEAFGALDVAWQFVASFSVRSAGKMPAARW